MGGGVQQHSISVSKVGTALLLVVSYFLFFFFSYSAICFTYPSLRPFVGASHQEPRSLAGRLRLAHLKGNGPFLHASGRSWFRGHPRNHGVPRPSCLYFYMATMAASLETIDVTLVFV